ncbi:hypothetical protein [Krasilnikovia sp. MM14-A1259]|uniref:hypothetical protein n=1 Tax=Krasilnikovia sp. MM14-A1259 TaxID=3373539 RepID=UPI00380F4900
MINVEVHQPRSAATRLPRFTLWVAGATVLTAPLLLLWSFVPGTLSLVLGVLAYRSTRHAAPRDATRGSMALAAGVVAFLAGLAILGIAFIVSGTAIFTG